MAIFGAVLFDEPQQAETGKRDLEHEGYGVRLRHQGDGSVVLVAASPGADIGESAVVARMQLLANDLGGEFLGHGGSEQYVLGDIPGLNVIVGGCCPVVG